MVLEKLCILIMSAVAMLALETTLAFTTDTIRLSSKHSLSRCSACPFFKLQRQFSTFSQALHYKRSDTLSSLHLSPILGPEAIELSSTKSSTVKLFQSIASRKKSRSEHNLTLVEGHRLVMEALSHPRTRDLFRSVLVSREALGRGELGGKLNDLLEIVHGKNGCMVNLASQQVVNAASDTQTPQGVVAVLKIPPSYVPDSATIIRRKQSKLFLILDGVSDPGNAGTLLRSSLAVGVEAVILLPSSCDIWSPKAVRSSMGAAFKVPTVSLGSWDECITFMEKCGLDASNIYAATMEGSSSTPSKPHYAVDWVGGNGAALVIGKEGQGLSNQVREYAKLGKIKSVYVPMETGIESLNAAICGSVILFEYHRQHCTIVQ